MFEDFANQWTPVLRTRDVGRKPRQTMVAGEPVVLFRGAGRRLGALLDRCPHRGVRLSLGAVTDTGCLQCPFHGWEFRLDGECRHVPFNPDVDRARLAATALPVRELGGLIWVHTGFDPGDSEPNVPDTLLDESLTRQSYWEEWDCHWTRAMENMLDYPHLPYLHRSTIGRFVISKQQRDSRLTIGLETTEYGYLARPSIDDVPPGAVLHWVRPNGMMLDTMPAPKVLRLHIFCVPLSPARTRMFLLTVRNFAQNPAASVAFDRFNIKVLHQDRATVESSDPAEVPSMAQAERSVPSDNATLRFRTWYLRQLKGTSVADHRASA